MIYLVQFRNPHIAEWTTAHETKRARRVPSLARSLRRELTPDMYVRAVAIGSEGEQLYEVEECDIQATFARIGAIH